MPNPDAETGDKLVVTKSFADDASNTPHSSVAVLHVGSEDALGHLSGIHGAHLSKTEYISTDSDDQKIPWVRKTNPDGSATEYIVSDVPVPKGARPD